MTREPDAKEILLKQNIRPSIVRVKVLEYLLNNRLHPSADEIYKDLAADMPTLSKTSVYNTLKLFISEKIVKQIDIDSFQVRYDAFMDFHGHFRCDECGKIYDFEIYELRDNLEEFMISKKEVYYFGVCKECLKKVNVG